jgi:nickel-dependent lactate racemase
MRIRLAFDKTGKDIEIPDGVSTQVLEPRFADSLPDEGGAIAAALDHPISSPSLTDLARGKKSAAIAVCDITRPAPNRVVLPQVTAALERGGIPRSGIRILIATGLHREATPGELQEIVGPEMIARYSVDSHHARVEAEQSYLGETKGGTAVYTDRRMIEADLHITLGFIEPHLMAGFSGGRKVLSIGLAGEKTIKRLHSPLFMRDRQATEGSFPDNPLHRELLEIAAKARHDFMVDVALTRTRGIAAVFAGSPVEAHAAGVEFVRETTLAGVDEPADAVITTSGGYPLDLTFYQAVKGITAAAHVVKPGGTILLVAACTEGVGGPEFQAIMRRSTDWETLLRELETRPVVTVDQWQAEKLAMVAEKAKLAYCVPGVPAADQQRFWGPAYGTPQEAVNALLRELPRPGQVVVIPEGPYVFSQVTGTAVAVG